MSERNDKIRRELTGNMPTGHYNMADMEFSVKKTEPEPEVLEFSMVLGVVMVRDSNGWRPATTEEIERLTGGVM